MTDGGEGVTHWLERLREGDPQAQEALVDLVYKDLHRQAKNYMRREQKARSLQPTALVNEAYLRLIAQPDRNWRNRNHFLAAASLAMRRILTDESRKRLAVKRGGDQRRVLLEDDSGLVVTNPEEMIALDDALTRLGEFDPELAEVVEWKFFAGASEQEIAQAAGVHVRTVRRRWDTAKTWLFGELKGKSTGASG